MKNLLVATIIFCLIFFSSIFSKSQNVLLNLCEEGQAEFFVLQIDDLPQFATALPCGEGYFVWCDVKLGNYLLQNLKYVLGITVKFDNSQNLNVEESLKLKILKTQNILEKTVIFGFSNYFENFVFIENKKVNVQIVKEGSFVIIGTPIIYGSY